MVQEDTPGATSTGDKLGQGKEEIRDHGVITVIREGSDSFKLWVRKENKLSYVDFL